MSGSVDLDTINDLEQRFALEVQIGEFGQVPKQLFTSPHPARLAPTTPDAKRRFVLGPYLSYLYQIILNILFCVGAYFVNESFKGARSYLRT